MSKNSRGNRISGIMGRLPGMIERGSRVGRGIADVFDPSGSLGAGVSRVGGSLQQGIGDIGNIRDQWKAGNYGGAIGGMSRLGGGIGRGIGGLGRAIGGRAGEGIDRVGGAIEGGSGFLGEAGNLVGMGQNAYRTGRDLVRQGVDQYRQGSYDELGNTIGRGMQDAMNYGGQMMNQVSRMRNQLGNRFNLRRAAR